MKMNANEIKTTARNMTISALLEVLQSLDAVQFADNSYAVLQNVGEQEVWTEITVKSKAYKPTKVSPAFDPFEVAEVWKQDKAIKAKEKEAKAKEKAAKVAKAKKEKEEEEA